MAFDMAFSAVMPREGGASGNRWRLRSNQDGTANWIIRFRG